MNWATLSAWIGAAVALATAIATAGREWWTRPMADWTVTGDVSQPDGLGPDVVRASLTVWNFGDGNAHRVSVYVRRGERCPPERKATSPLLRPGDSVAVAFGALTADWPSTTIFITWTPPPIRRHKEHTSEPLRVESETVPTDRARQALTAARQADRTGSIDGGPHRQDGSS